MTSRSAPFVALLLLAPSLAFGEESDPTPSPSFADRGVHLGLGSGWGLPLGNAQSGLPLGDAIVGQAPLALDASFRALPQVFVGAYVGWGFGALQDCPDEARCRGKDVRFGLNGRYFFGSRPAIPWVGLGAGFESFSTRVAAEERDYQGITFIDLELGLDVPLTSRLAIGPAVTLSAGEFTRATVEGADSPDVEGEIAETRLHGWALFGARVVLAL